MGHHYLVTGGAGFIGSNYVDRLLTRGDCVTVFDNLARGGAARNLDWLTQRHGHSKNFTFIKGDVRDFVALQAAAQSASVIVHLAAQVAVTCSVQNPREDLEINALGTLNVLEAARLSGQRPIVVYASTNKVYGGLKHHQVIEGELRYTLANLPTGVSESHELDFHSPYGCSKGAADQYVHDYARIYDIPTVVLRQSCIYGPRQFGMEDQGWVAWFMIQAALGRPITVFGDGKQVRDLLHIDDLMDVFDIVIRETSRSAGEVFNVGGGPKNSLSVWAELQPLLASLNGKKIDAKFGEWRAGDQRVFISDISKLERIFGWKPTVSPQQGIERLHAWITENKMLFA
jgi:CDP-paratose 2-epimerase